MILHIQMILDKKDQSKHLFTTVKQLLNRMAASVNAQMTEIHKQKQLNRPFFPSLQVLRTVTPIAHKGASTQKMIS